jgi:hypothetical protein
MSYHPVISEAYDVPGIPSVPLPSFSPKA